MRARTLRPGRARCDARDGARAMQGRPTGRVAGAHVRDRGRTAALLPLAARAQTPCVQGFEQTIPVKSLRARGGAGPRADQVGNAPHGPRSGIPAA